LLSSLDALLYSLGLACSSFFSPGGSSRARHHRQPHRLRHHRFRRRREARPPSVSATRPAPTTQPARKLPRRCCNNLPPASFSLSPGPSFASALPLGNGPPLPYKPRTAPPPYRRRNPARPPRADFHPAPHRPVPTPAPSALQASARAKASAKRRRLRPISRGRHAASVLQAWTAPPNVQG